MQTQVQNSASRLIDAEELLSLYPALRSRKGKKPTFRLEWLVRSRQIPIVRIGRRVYFDPAEIETWIDSKKIPAGSVQSGD